MKFFLNYSGISKFDKDILWFVAQDIEHLKTLHKKTNCDVTVNNIAKSENKKNLYSFIEYTTRRKILKFITVRVETSRKIYGEKIIYIERHKYLRTVIKNTHYIEDGENYFILKDNLEIDTPFVIYLFQPIIKFLIMKHLKSQFNEDEIFRKRLQLIQPNIFF